MNTTTYKMLALAATVAMQSSLMTTSTFAQPQRKTTQKAVVATREYKGKVIDAATGEPLAGIRIQAYNYPLAAAMTEDDGTFTIKLPDFVSQVCHQQCHQGIHFILRSFPVFSGKGKYGQILHTE